MVGVLIVGCGVFDGCGGWWVVGRLCGDLLEVMNFVVLFDGFFWKFVLVEYLCWWWGECVIVCGGV